MQIYSTERETIKGPAEWFTGDVFIDPVHSPNEHTRVGAAHVRFTPGARTAWHFHPHGQVLYVTEGVGYVCRRGGEPQEIRQGDTVFIEPGEEHWHGATASRYMCHVAIQESDESGSPVTWLEHVED